MSISDISTESLETMSSLTNTSKYGKSWRESLESKYKIPKKEEEFDIWKSNVERMKDEIENKIEEIQEERKKDMKIFLNCFLEKEKFSKHMNEIFGKFGKQTTTRKRNFEEI